jgi:hypothetical protein
VAVPLALPSGCGTVALDGPEERRLPGEVKMRRR